MSDTHMQADLLIAEAERDLIPRLVDWGFRAHAIMSEVLEDANRAEVAEKHDPDVRLSAALDALSEIALSFQWGSSEQIRAELATASRFYGMEVNA